MVTKYTTVAGDTWDAIAYRALGSELLMGDMLNANPTHNYVAEFAAGVELDVPDVAVDTTLSSGLPPWRRP